MFTAALSENEVNALALETAKRVTPNLADLEATARLLLENYYLAKCVIDGYLPDA